MSRLITAAWLKRTLGRRSAPARHLLPALHATLPDDLPPAARAELATRLYYTLVIRRVAAHRLYPQALPPPADIDSGACFVAAGYADFTGGEPAAAGLDGAALRGPLTDLGRAVQAGQWGPGSPGDVFKRLHHDLFSATQRQAGGAFYTPDWLAAAVLDTLGCDGTRSLIDPACGSGTFLALALQRARRHFSPAQALARLAGVDVDPLAALAARASLLLGIGPHRDGALHLPVYTADTLLQPPDIGPFALVAGNPPWVNREGIPADYWRKTLPLWEQYGLFPHAGMASILGQGRKDLAMLMLYTAADRYLLPGGHLGFILPQSLLKSGAAGAGFRRFGGAGAPLRVWRVDDLSALQPFAGAVAPAILLFLQKGQPTTYPVPYHLWRPRSRRRIPADYAGSMDALLECLPAEAEPAVPGDAAAPWRTGQPGSRGLLDKLRGPSDYVAHAGAYTGGANGVYWLEVLARLPGGRVQVRNCTEQARRPVPVVEAILEADLVYPLLRGRDVARWQAAPGAHILLVQDARTRQGYAPDWLQTQYPLTWAYLQPFAPLLRARPTVQRYFKEDVPFYTMFDIGPYTFAPVKVIWQGMGAGHMRAAVVTTVAQRPVITNQAMHPFIALEAHQAQEAHYLAACLNSAPFEFAVLSHSGKRSKSFAQPGLLKLLRLPRYDAASPVHRHLAELSRAGHAGTPPASADLTQAAAALWGLTRQDLAVLPGPEPPA
ncbi:MAG: SAM-dependent methyltransferase [Anaerolineae bacterium]|nr:SAM-dependent methyltransferase [Anaerolineae bacterium]